MADTYYPGSRTSTNATPILGVNSYVTRAGEVHDWDADPTGALGATGYLIISASDSSPLTHTESYGEASTDDADDPITPQVGVAFVFTRSVRGSFLG